ncbi:hypothetical protein AZE42_12134 [Rhizopogon vesiculosus]|uniref:Uncharacterized protein n=1 Tax=Rhizopogon vesiculosus TaxID=180088 RepID=A0A1J8Q9R6_9AGAM|nr:hypothetical protein AZE42_12134 [Rhizopogon vesiculosus]
MSCPPESSILSLSQHYHTAALIFLLAQ